MTVEENKQLIQKYYNVMWNDWNFAITDKIISEAFEFYGSIGIATKGRYGFKEYMNTIRAAFPDFHNTIEDLIAERDKVVAKLTYTGTHQGPLFGITPTGKHIEYAGTAIFRIKVGQIIHGWVLGDRLGLLQQLGAIASFS